MKQPLGYIKEEGKVCKLIKSLYGLKQAPRCFNVKFKEVLEKFKMKVSSADSCVYIKRSEGSQMILAMYVDDGLSISNDLKLFAEFLYHLKEHFKMPSQTNRRYVSVSQFLCKMRLVL